MNEIDTVVKTCPSKHRLLFVKCRLIFFWCLDDMNFEEQWSIKIEPIFKAISKSATF